MHNVDYENAKINISKNYNKESQNSNGKTQLSKVSPQIIFTNSTDNVEFLTTFTYPSFEQPTPQYPLDFTAGSLAAQDPTFAQISLTYDYDKFVSECTPPHHQS
jgi:hypothetical protein